MEKKVIFLSDGLKLPAILSLPENLRAGEQRP
jgi:hypothetical protein